jgi:uncharacterized protein (DUF2236 family)
VTDLALAPVDDAAEQAAPDGETARRDARIGLHGPRSAMWQVNREAVLLAAGPAALLLQVAHPMVAEGVAAHSDFEADPFGRLRRTLRTTLALVFGDGPEAERAIGKLNAIHGGIRGEVRDPLARATSGAAAYAALDPDLLLWVQATLVVTSVRAYQSWVAPLSLETRDRLWQEARLTGRSLGIPSEVAPPDWASLEAWFEAQVRPGGPIVVTDTARRLSASILHPPVRLVPQRLMDVVMLPGLALLPPGIRTGYGLEWTPAQARLAQALSLGLHAWVAAMPRSWRALPQARKAEARTSDLRPAPGHHSR